MLLSVFTLRSLKVASLGTGIWAALKRRLRALAFHELGRGIAQRLLKSIVVVPRGGET